MSKSTFKTGGVKAGDMGRTDLANNSRGKMNLGGKGSSNHQLQKAEPNNMGKRIDGRIDRMAKNRALFTG